MMFGRLPQFQLLAFTVLSSRFSNWGNVVLASSSWVDPQTPQEARTTTGMKDQRELTLVFSDEFGDAGRSFGDGSDSRWTAEDRPAVVNAALHYYNSSHVTTTDDGKLSIQTTRKDSNWVEYDFVGREYYFKRDYQSAMVTTWNKFCFTSGVIEISVQLPGKPLRGGLWPAFWMLGNLARPNYLNSTNGIWPWSYDTCGDSQEARDASAVQKLSACRTANARGRGSPEIDIIESQPGDFVLQYESVLQVDGTYKSMSVARPMISSSLQLSPGVASNRRPVVPNFPQEGQWYPPLFPMGGPAYGEAESTETPHMLNTYWYGQLINEDPPVWQDGMSVNWQHSTDYFSQQTVIRTEWQAGKDDGYVRWFNGEGHLMYEITAGTLKGKPGAADAIAQIPYEAMYLILNTDISPRWGWNGCDPNSPCMLANPGLCSPDGQLLCRDCANPECLKCPEQTAWLADFCEDVDPENPAEYLIDYVRVYQDPNDPAHSVGCDPSELPTRKYIQENWKDYTFNHYIKKEPLKSVKNGGGTCFNDDDCRGSSQRVALCEDGQCSCPPGWTGSHCLSPCVGEYAVNCSSVDPPSSSPSSSTSPTKVPTVETPSTSPSSLDAPTIQPGNTTFNASAPSTTSVPSLIPTNVPSSETPSFGLPNTFVPSTSIGPTAVPATPNATSLSPTDLPTDFPTNASGPTNAPSLPTLSPANATPNASSVVSQVPTVIPSVVPSNNVTSSNPTTPPTNVTVEIPVRTMAPDAGNTTIETERPSAKPTTMTPPTLRPVVSSAEPSSDPSTAEPTNSPISIESLPTENPTQLLSTSNAPGEISVHKSLFLHVLLVAASLYSTSMVF